MYASFQAGYFRNVQNGFYQTPKSELNWEAKLVAKVAVASQTASRYVTGEYLQGIIFLCSRISFSNAITMI